MIEFTSGDILKADVDAIVNTVNCVGVMGRGIALQFKKAYPENFKSYAAACQQKTVQPGNMFVFETHQLTNPQFIINFPTKRHWKAVSRLEDIESGLINLVSVIKKNDIRSIAIPPLGSGLGGLDWSIVREKITTALQLLTDVQVFVYEPQGAPENDKMVRNKKIPKMTAGRAVLVELIRRYIGGLLDPSMSLIEVQKLMYFMQEAGEPLRLKFKKALYGPYAENLRHVLNEMEGHLISGYADGGDEPDKQLELIPGAAEQAKVFLAAYPETMKRFEKVSKLIEGFESSYGLELLVTSHWVKKHEGAVSDDEVVSAIKTWNTRKAELFSERQIKIANKTLHGAQWV